MSRRPEKGMGGSADEERSKNKAQRLLLQLQLLSANDEQEEGSEQKDNSSRRASVDDSGSGLSVEVARGGGGGSDAMSQGASFGKGRRALLVEGSLKAEAGAAAEEKEGEDEERFKNKAERLLFQLQLLREVKEDSLPFVVESGVDARAYNKLLELDHPFKLDWKNGALRIVTIPSQEHERASRYCAVYFGNIFGQHLTSTGSTTWQTTGTTDMEADESWARPPPVGQTGPPFDDVLAFVVEIGWSQAEPDLINRAERWIRETSCNEVLLVSIFDWPRDCWAQVWRRVDDGPERMDHADLCWWHRPGQVFMHISLRSVFNCELRFIPREVLNNAMCDAVNGNLLVDLYHIVWAARATARQRELIANDRHYQLHIQPAQAPTTSRAPPAPTTSIAPAESKKIPTHYNDAVYEVLREKVNHWVKPLADRVLCNRIYKMLRRVATHAGERLLIGSEQVEAELEAGSSGIVFIAGNTNPRDLKYQNIATTCRGKNGVGYVFTPSHAYLAQAIGQDLPEPRVNIIMLKAGDLNPGYKSFFSEIRELGNP